MTKTKDVIGAYRSIDFSFVREKYKDAGTRYCFDVLDEKIVTGYYIKLACFRHLRDLQRQGQEDFPYVYSVDAFNRFLKFLSLVPNVDDLSQKLKPMNWQLFIFSQLFAWLDLDGLPRYVNIILSMARAQGKTMIAGISLNYSFLIETIGLSNQDFLVSSLNFEQTMKLYTYVKSMMSRIIENEPFKSLATEIGLQLYTREIKATADSNSIQTISFESGKFDSKHFKLAVADEVGELRSDEGISKITSGQVNTEGSRFIEISTAYQVPNVPFHKEQKKLIEIMERDFDRAGDDQLCLIWSQDSLEETFQPETWAKSNPLLNHSELKDNLMKGLVSERDKKMLMAKLADFQVKNMNCWLNADSNSFLDLEDIEKATIDDFPRDNRRVYIGVDYSLFSDNTAIAFVYPYSGEEKWHIEQHSFIPWKTAGSIEAKEKQDGLNYRELEKEGYCTITSHPQGLINEDEVYEWIINYVEEHQLDVIFFGYDAMGVTKVIKALELNTSFPLMPIRQRTSELKDPTKFLQKIFVEGSVTRLDDKIMEKALINAVIKEDNIGIQVDKMKSTLKVDVVDALIDGMYQAMYHYEDYGLANDKTYQVEHMSPQAVLDWLNNPESGLLEEEFY
ncbi:terminase TerL endonuclease subunit [Streptococcus anginosus]|uniref:terminase large subunit n=1 Tax=Streptococcus anginosus TaxID=1328 RepID=UPI0023A9B2D8|nr:terminase TerL endonuclease subunit [Streptococcus anginosus]MED5843832.1 terminase TerL endonuclease subunit [Streptococcus anginosus]MED5870929.1 terminase TerL endonuclease subunit [Streptococcus anginosus]MED5900411.1 terminase TerL endonuclease subunit [Streptococcus anginosus]MED5909913.1 terminase TerL endonuclease subunit [Streptococcus anginosus]MED5970404.1 terminase TerL endonuclease subunit [Streptococcus anginosus]